MDIDPISSKLDLNKHLLHFTYKSDGKKCEGSILNGILQLGQIIIKCRRFTNRQPFIGYNPIY